MDINTRNLGFVNFNGQEMQWVKFNGVTVYEAWRDLIANGVPPLTLLNCKGVDLIDYKIYGNSVQEGENLFSPSIPLTSGVYLNDSGQEVSHASWNITDYIEVNGNKFTLTNVGGQSPSVCAYDENKNFITGVKYGTSSADIKTDVTISSNTLIKYIRISIYNRWTVEGDVYDMKLLYLPTPDTPVEVESVGDKSKNLLPSDVLDINSYGQHYDAYTNTVYKLPFVEPNKTYTLSCDYEKLYDGVYYYIRKYKDGVTSLEKYFITNTTPSGKIIYTFTAQENTEYFLDGNNTKYLVPALESISNFQIEENSEATDYESYGKYKIPVKVSGKNLLNKDTAQEGYFIHASGEKRATQSYGLKVTEPIPINPSKTYYYSGMGNVTATTVTRVGYEYDKDDNPIKALGGSDGRGIYFEPQPNCAYVLLQYVKTEEQPMFYEYYLGVTDDYEPYVEPITTNIYLDEPLRKVGDYADYIDFKKQKVFRNVEVLDDTGTLTTEESLKGVVDNTGTPIELPNIPTIKGTTMIEIDTKVNSSYMEVVYKGKGKLELLVEEENLVLNSILNTNTETQLNITNTEINEILDEIIGG